MSFLSKWILLIIGAVLFVFTHSYGKDNIIIWFIVLVLIFPMLMDSSEMKDYD